ncbi:probable disease resistance protein At1g61300 isoform X1 [Coffea arabica]|nr:disease resistance protein SUMM2-like isoform X1 [Coffea arabica]
MSKQMRILNARETDIRQMVTIERVRNGMEPKAEVKLWLENVDQIKDSVNKVKEDSADDRRCLIGCFPNYYFRMKLGNMVEEQIHKVNELLEQGKFSEGAVVGMLPERGKTLPTTMLMGETAKRSSRRIWHYLMDESIRTIGIFGMGGVGKTTIMIEINNRLVREDVYFDTVIWVTASREPNLPKLQNDIAKSIGLCFDSDDDGMTRASKLWNALRGPKKFLLIIDDLWEAFSHQEVGIPCQEFSNSFKLVITTRSLSVCRGMETMREVEVELLSSEEAWDLFKHKVGEEVVSSLSIEAVAKEIAKECGGLPLAIATVGRALRKEYNVRQWRIALRELQNSTIRIDGMENQVLSRLRFSYERLKDDTTRSCFLFCAVYPKDHHVNVEELIRYWIYEGLLGNLGDMETKMQQGYILVDELKNACMLESICQHGSIDEHVKMHDLIRDMAIALTGANQIYMVRARHSICKPPLHEEWHPDLERVSLMRNDLSSLDCEPRCPKLSTLLLQYNSLSKGINPSFFNHMQNLQVLDLSYTGILRLPDSFSNLENLRALLLCSCWNLHYVPTLSKLKELRVLDLSYSSIEHMPHGMEMLANLRRLDLSHCRANDFQSSFLSNYRMLENLLLIGLWQSLELGKVFVDQLTSCINLSLFEANFRTVEDFNYYTMSGHWSQVESFKFCIGYPESSMHFGRNSVALIGAHMFHREIPALLPGRIHELVLLACSGINHLPTSISFASSQLQICKLQHCDDMEWIITSGWSTFPTLESLEIEGLGKLHTFCMGIPQEGTLANLKVLHVTQCNDLKTVLSFELVQNLKSLEEIVIENCERIEEIIGDERGGEDVTQVDNAEIILPRLQKLKLSSLPRLTSICWNRVMICDSLSIIEVHKCPELTALPFFVEIRQPLIQSLKQIKGSRRWREDLTKSHPDCIGLLYSIFKVTQSSAAYDIFEPQNSAANEIFEEDDGRNIGESASSSFGPR